LLLQNNLVVIVMPLLGYSCDLTNLDDQARQHFHLFIFNLVGFLTLFIAYVKKDSQNLTLCKNL
jgi:hypothetical protein